MMATTERHYVTFYSPGTLVSESTRKPIDSWDTREAVTMAEQVVERYGAKPFGFVFTTVVTADPVPDGHGGTLRVEERETMRSGTHYLGGQLHTLAEIESRNDPAERILRSNMSGNDDPIVVKGQSGYSWCHVFREQDVIVDAAGKIVERGDDPKHVAYRAHERRKTKTGT